MDTRPLYVSFEGYVEVEVQIVNSPRSSNLTLREIMGTRGTLRVGQIMGLYCLRSLDALFFFFILGFAGSPPSNFRLA